jgi:CRP-like cAMP-binding protein
MAIQSPALSRYLRSHPTGTVLFEQGQLAVEAMVIERGRVILSRAAHDYTLWIGTFGPGAILGEVALCTGQRHEATATALDEVSLVHIDGPSFEAMIASAPEIAMRVIKAMAEREEANIRRIAALASRDPLARLITFFSEAVSAGAQEITGDPQELAVSLVLAQEEVEVALARLLRARLLTPTANGGLEVPDVSQMWEFYDFYDRRRRGE